MKLNELSPAVGSTKEAYRKGRGAGSGNGKYHSAHLMSRKIFCTTAQTFADPRVRAYGV